MAAAPAVHAAGAIEEVVVTGSFIKGTPEDAALPVEVTTRADLEDIGMPSSRSGWKITAATSVRRLIRSWPSAGRQPILSRCAVPLPPPSAARLKLVLSRPFLGKGRLFYASVL